MIQRHEKRVDNNAKCDKKLDERIENNPRDPFLQFKPAVAAIPNAKGVNAFKCRFNHFLFHGWTVFIVFFFCWEIVDRH